MILLIFSTTSLIGSNNFPSSVYANPPELIDWLAEQMLTFKVKPEIEIFDLSHLFKAAEMYKLGKFYGTPYIQFVMGVKNAMPADKSVFNFYITKTKNLFKNVNWCAAGIGKYQIQVNEWCVNDGGHTRTGMEDNIRIDRENLAPSNAALVDLTVKICEKHKRPVANWKQTREILDFPLLK